MRYLYSLEDFLMFLETQAKNPLPLENPNKTDERNRIYSRGSTGRLKFYKTKKSRKCGVYPDIHATTPVRNY